MKEQNSELIERYVYAVTRRLSADQRDDVADELRASIEDALEAKGGRSKKNVEAVLLSLGNPEKLALQYSGKPQYLIGPLFYPLWLQGMRYGLSFGLPIALVVQLITRSSDIGNGGAPYAVDVVGGLISVALHILFWVTLTLFIVERAAQYSGTDVAKELNTWKPSMLPQLPKAYSIPLSDIIAEYWWYAFLIALPLVAQRYLIGIRDEGAFTPFFDPAIWETGAFMVVALGVVGLLVTGLKHYRRSWTWDVAVSQSLLLAVTAGFLVAVLFKADLVNPAFISVLGENGVKDAANVVDRAVWLTLVIAAAASVVEAVKVIFNARRQSSRK